MRNLKLKFENEIEKTKRLRRSEYLQVISMVINANVRLTSQPAILTSTWYVVRVCSSGFKNRFFDTQFAFRTANFVGLDAKSLRQSLATEGKRIIHVFGVKVRPHQSGLNVNRDRYSI